jgi:hypothetical protein
MAAVIVQVSRDSWRLKSSEGPDELRDPDGASLEMRLEAISERNWSSTWGR